MASATHQFILGLVIRSMRRYGAEIHGIHGNYPGKLGQPVPVPPEIERHKPDTLGLTLDGVLCTGDAKTESDIQSKRTAEQIADFCGFSFMGKPCEVFIGIPSSSEAALKRVLRKHGLDHCLNLHVILVPDEIING